eukprot:TRINITY_DN6349_c0_g1_i1.p1 TRINITY_DN6349_c0_g1~~TRINITY_DN6349_c0_g1_i1.p1  ORF type:complete len:495 (-),score=55.71 TRINITY_DN6349_c0_g1_i1:131-1615(-)
MIGRRLTSQRKGTCLFWSDYLNLVHKRCYVTIMGRGFTSKPEELDYQPPRSKDLPDTWPITKWWIFDKTPGMRAIWDPVNREFFSLYGRKLEAPDSLKKIMGSVWFDGVISLPHENPTRYCIFDSPRPDIRKESFEVRYSAAREALSQYRIPTHDNSPILYLASYEIVDSVDQIEAKLSYAKDKQVDLIFRDPAAPYDNISYSLILAKNSKISLARILGDGRQEDEVRCNLAGVNNTFYAKVPPFLQSDTFRIAQFVEVDTSKNIMIAKRPDIHSWIESKYNMLFKENAKLYKFAFEYQFDPLVVSNWERFSRKFLREKGVLKISRKIHPELDLFDSYGTRKMREVKSVLDSIAVEYDFDPYIEENWRQVENDVISLKLDPLIRYNQAFREFHSNGKILNAVYKFDYNGEVTQEQNKNKNWSNITHRKRLLNQIAQELGIDPTSTSSWVSLSVAQLRSTALGRLFYKNFCRKGVLQAITEAFPGLDWDSAQHDE